jgi:Flp pilus assembly protein TadD
MAYNNLGVALLHQGQLGEAKVLFQKVLEIQPDNVEAYCNLGTVFDQQGRVDEALVQFRKAMELQPRSVLVQNNFGNLLSRMGRVDEAMAYYRQVLEVDTNSTVALNNLAWLLATASDSRWRNGGEAVRLAERACQLTQYKEAFLIGTLAAAYAEAGRFSDAVATAQKARTVALAHEEKEIAASNEHLLELYQSGRACHQEAQTVPPNP